MNLTEELLGKIDETSISEAGDFFRVPKKIIDKEVFILLKSVKSVKESLNADNDLDITMWNQVKNLVNTIDKSIVKNKKD